MIKVDKEVCIGCGTCVALAPDVFKMEDDGKAVAYTQENIEGGKQAAESCPVQAISVT